VVLVFVEYADGQLDELSQQALTFARGLGDPVHAVLVGEAPDAIASSLGAYGVYEAHVATGLGSYAPAAWAQGIAELIDGLAPESVLAAGTDRGNELLAHVAAHLDQPLAANCVSAAVGSPAEVTRVRWGGSLLEEARVHGSPLLLTVAAHAVGADPVSAVGAVALLPFAPRVEEGDSIVHVAERVPAVSAGVSLADADVVVSGGRGVGSAEGFSVIEELAALLGAAVGCSRAVTSAGWRPHTDQVGQTGTKISPEIYIACGISGATQHMAGCKGAKKLLAINPDAEASIFVSADYAVIGDLHEVVPAISAEIRKSRGP
jgi:electron transfer flavoprotein alpha subunit